MGWLTCQYSVPPKGRAETATACARSAVSTAAPTAVLTPGYRSGWSYSECSTRAGRRRPATQPRGGGEEVGGHHRASGDGQHGQERPDRRRGDPELLGGQPPCPPPGRHAQRKAGQERNQGEGCGLPGDHGRDLTTDKPQRSEDRHVPAAPADRADQSMSHGAHGKQSDHDGEQAGQVLNAPDVADVGVGAGADHRAPEVPPEPCDSLAGVSARGEAHHEQRRVQH